jgi:hypothetical protein
MPKLTPAQMKAAVEEFKKRFTPGYYHASPSPKIEAFDPTKSSKPEEYITPGVTFLSQHPKFVHDYLLMKNKSSKMVGQPDQYVTGGTIYPVSANLGKQFNFETPEGRAVTKAFIKDKLIPQEGEKKAANWLAGMQDELNTWKSLEHPDFLEHLKNQGYNSFTVKEAGIDNVGIFDPKNIRGKFAKYNPEDAESPDFMKAKGGAIKSGLSALKRHPHGQDPKVAQALEEYLKGNISQEERIRILNQQLPIRKWSELPPAYTDEQIINALMSSKQAKALAPIPAGMRVGNRLDIPAYTQKGVYVDTTHDPSGKAISYGRTGHLKDVEFTSRPNQAVRVGLGTKEQALTPMGAEIGSAKSPFALIKGTNVGTSDDEVRRMMAEMLNDPNYTQIGMDPRRHSQFYDKSTGLPVFRAEEKLQSGPLIIAPRKDLEITDWNDPRLELTDFPGKKYAGGGKVNVAVELAKKIAPKFSLESIQNMPVSSAQKQVPVARAFQMLSSENVDPKVKQQIFKQYLQINPDLVKKSGATNYDELTQAAYQQMAKETADQFQALQGSGVKLSFDPTGEKAYKSSKEMLEDALQNKRLTVFQGGEPHPALNKEANEQFRAVHDYFGHGTTGASFGPKGEELAYGAHSQMYSPLARLAAATETRGQNSLVSYSGMNEELINAMNQLKAQREQLIKSGGDPSAINDQLVKLGQQFKYAPQKPLILPPEQIDINYQGFAGGGKIGKMLEHAKSLPFVHFSNAPSISQLDPRMYGKGIKGAEADRLKEALDIKPRSYFYVDKPGVKPEQGLGPHKYQGMAEDIYPLHEDPLGLSAIAKQKSLDPYLMSQGIQQVDEKQQLNELERLIKQAGYKGYANDDVGLLFYPTPVKKAVEGKAEGGSVFNPEGAGYDYQTAMAYGMGPTGTGEDLGHWGSVAPTSDDERMLRDLPRDAYVMLKGKAHETFDKAEAAEKERGSKVVKIGDRYYSIPK